jgi:hypothetical protein
MRAISRLVLVAALMFGLMPATTSAQRWTADFGVNGGWSWYSNMVDEGEVRNVDDLRFRHGWLTGAQLTVNPWSRLGVRANLTYTDRPIETAGQSLLGVGIGTGETVLGNVNLWSGSIDALFRFRAPNETWQGAETIPYVAFGVGGKWTNPAGDPFVCADFVNSPNQQWECTPFRAPGMTGDTVLALGEQSVVMGLAGLGADFRLSPRTALRLEGNARVYRPQIYRAVHDQGNRYTLPFGDRLASEWMTELSATLGLHLLMGLRTPPPVAVAPLPPAPPPPPPPPPPAPAAPREDAVTICVIDPTATGGVRMQTATFRHAQGDTIVMVDGQARPIGQVVGTGVMTARDAGWYVRGEPLTLTVGRETIRFLPYQTATRIEPARIVYIGNVQGFPVYADRDEIADVLPALQTARGTRTDLELGTMLAGVDARTRDVVQRATFMYVPMDPYNCVFQPVQRVEDVRKGK